MTENDQNTNASVQNPDGQPVTSASDQVNNVNEAVTQDSAPAEQPVQNAAPVDSTPSQPTNEQPQQDTQNQ